MLFLRAFVVRVVFMAKKRSQWLYRFVELTFISAFLTATDEEKDGSPYLEKDTSRIFSCMLSFRNANGIS